MAEAGGDQFEPQEASQLLLSILSPKSFEEATRLAQDDVDLVHYTTAENAVNILKGREFWLRSVRTMNDFMEVEHGKSMLLQAFSGEGKERINRLCNALDQIHEGAARKAVDLFNEWMPRIADTAYIGCLSLAEVSETRGRLSMWRGYSSPSVGVCIVMNKGPFLAETDLLKAYSVPVAYLTNEQFLEGVDQSLAAIEAQIEKFKGLGEEEIVATVFWWFLAMSVSLKHPGFYEEREWRIIYFPEMERSAVIEEAVTSVRGVPQIIQKIPLRDDEAVGLHGASPKSLIKKLIVGPSEYAATVRAALIQQLKDADVDEPESKVMISDIPLR